MSKPTLGYWDIRGFGQPARYLLAYLGIDYEEKRYESSDDEAWFPVKFTLGLDFPNLPYWIDDKVKITEKHAIVKYLSRKYGPSLIPPEDKLWASEMLEGVLIDTWELLVMICYRPSEEAETQFKANHPLKLGQLNSFIGDKSFCMGNAPTYIDFLAYELCYHYKVLSGDNVNPFPNILKFMKNFEELAPIKAYRNSPTYIKGPCFSKHQQKYFI